MSNNVCLLYHHSDTKKSENSIFTERFERPNYISTFNNSQRWKATRFPVGSVTSRLNSPPKAFTYRLSVDSLGSL